jgi:hypothetical protein
MVTWMPRPITSAAQTSSLVKRVQGNAEYIRTVEVPFPAESPHRPTNS